MKRSLNTEFRPQALEEFIGSEDVIRSIQETLKQGRVENTYLFSGPPGTGKTSIARVVAKLINGKLEDYDITEPDTSEMNADGMRSLVQQSFFNPWTGKYKCIILDEAHKLKTDAQTILLKALEEPAISTVWFVCSSEPGKLSEAFRRRGTHHIMRGLSQDQVKQFVLSTIKKVGGEVDTKYLQTPGPNKQTLAYDLADALITHEVTSPGLIIKAIEKLITGTPASEAAQVQEVTEVDTFAISKATAYGNWAELQKLLKDAPRTAAREIRGNVAGFFRAILIKEPAGSKRAERCVWAIKQMAELANQNQFEDGLIWAATCAALYSICIGQKEYIAKKG